MHVWNYHEQADGRGMRDTNIYYSTVPTADASNFASGDWTLFGAKTMTAVPASDFFIPYTPTDNIAMGGLTARVIGIEILNSVSDPNNVGIGKLQFDGTLVSEPSSSFAITEIDYDPDADPPTVTLTWRSRPGTTYGAFSSFDLSDWSNEVADSLDADTEGIIVDGNLLTMSFKLEDGLENATDLFLRIQEE
jgi:hypothetical protein